MPQRVNSKSDIGTSKIASDSYDTNNIFLTDQGWVYRHWKGDPKTTDRYWDEIIVAGQVIHPSGLDDNDLTVDNGLVQETEYIDANSEPSGSQKYPSTLLTSGYEPTPVADPGTPDDQFDIAYAGDIHIENDVKFVPLPADFDADGNNKIAAAQATAVETDSVARNAGSAYDQFPEDTTSTDDGNTGDGGSTPPPPAPSDVTLVFTGADGTSSYTSAGGANASVSIAVGGTLTITNNTGGHPVDVRVADGGATVSTGTLTGAPANSGESLTWDTTGVTPGTYYYQCTSHASMIGTINVTA